MNYKKFCKLYDTAMLIINDYSFSHKFEWDVHNDIVSISNFCYNSDDNTICIEYKVCLVKYECVYGSYEYSIDKEYGSITLPINVFENWDDDNVRGKYITQWKEEYNKKKIKKEEELKLKREEEERKKEEYTKQNELEQLAMLKQKYENK